ncbi:AAA family ATPase [Gilliamella intestini]|uniref:C-terminal, D2-small domain-containing protein, of ClpB protein n=1 Tax=Gilliamella intestini TaxID=1798183 RepID=A0A1C4A3Z6_9GAMM|nr:AAA family ATPase [Gilliamella intestini]SCB89246.1 C-terminal, D2-small domain-containing protein, of ClpB protein [Gilliamella intestini]
MFENPRWVRDLLRFLPLKSQFVLSGNIRDLQACEIVPSVITPQSFELTVYRCLKQVGYEHVVIWDPLSGFRCLQTADFPANNTDQLLQKLGLTPENGKAAGGVDLLSSVLERLVNFVGDPIALLVDFASQLSVRTDNLTPAEHQLFTRALILSHQAKVRPAGENRQPFFNTVLWVVEKEGDLPDWFLVNNPKVRSISVAKPDHIARRALAGALIKGISHAQQLPDEILTQAEKTFVNSTEGMLLLDMNAIATLARVENIGVNVIADAVRRYKVGVTEDPWQKIDREKIQQAETFISQRVKGQMHAVTHMLDIVKRAITGIGVNRKGNRPRGVMFLAGPTGVGKTELAKTITSLLFNDESAYIRFDMSEFSSEHSDQRLIGAPPGYVGYDVGGELTNAIREKPFSVVLFDEIEKAHPRILDKFLQILDDGELTSGRGDRVYFSEALIIFTSNLGIYKMTETGKREVNVSADDSFDVVQLRVKNEIDHYFKVVLNRPEILNRIGENIVVFDFIRPEIAEQIFQQMVANILNDFKQTGLTLTFSPNAMHSLKMLALTDLSNGGRGIRNQLEAHLLNPLARELFALNPQAGQHVTITSVQANAITLEL